MKGRHHLMHCLLLGLNSCLLTGDQGLRAVAKHLFSGRRKASGWVEDPVTKSSTGLGAAQCGMGKGSLSRPEYPRSC